MSAEIEVFGIEGARAIEWCRSALPKIRGTVFDVPEDVFESVMNQSVADGQRVYWDEMLGRAYLAASGSLLRSDDWIKGLIASYQDASYLGFCAALRGLLESAADSMYSLRPIAPTLADVWPRLRGILSGKSGSDLLICSELEELLIHFTYARKTKRGEKAPTGHSALFNRDYIDTIREFDPELERLYCFLVEVVHPARDSLSWAISHEAQESYWRVTLRSDESGGQAICQILDDFRGAIESLLMVSLNYSLIVLKMLRRLDFGEVDLSVMDSIDLTTVKAWQDIAPRIKS